MPRPVTWLQPHKVLEALRRERVGVVHLHGHWDESESVVLGIRSYDELLNRPDAQAIQQAIALLRTLVFVGCGTGLSDPNLGELLRWLGANFSSSGHMHMRLVTESEVADARKQHAPSVIEPIVYGEKFTDLEPFLAYVAAERTRLAPTAADDIRAALQHADAAERERLGR